MKMKKNIYAFIIIVAGLTITSCSDYLDQVPDDVINIDDVFAKRTDVEKYLANVYSYIPEEERVNQNASGIGDELDITFAEYDETYINKGDMTPSKGYRQSWSNYYKGIRSASIFIEKIDECQDPDMTQALKTQYKAEARYLRAFYYFCLFRWYGPFVIMPDKAIASDASLNEMSIPRSTVDECVDYMVAELEKASNEGLPDWYEKATDYGRATIAAAKALEVRILLYAASPLFNGNTNYANFKNQDGTVLVSQIKDVSKWKKAADAAKAFISRYSSRFSLYTEKNEDGTLDPFKSYQYLFLSAWGSNNEVIWAKPSCSYWDFEANSPRFCNGWSGWDPTQNIVDDYFTVNGLPVQSESFADADPTYTEVGTSKNTIGYAQKGTLNMYVNREPRFYASICYDNSVWLATARANTCELYYNGNTGKKSGTRNYSQTGYILRKFNNPAVDWYTSQSVSNRSELIFRLGEIYLNYAEALNESDPGNEDILKYINLIRDRAGVPEYGIGPEQIHLKSDSQDAIRELIHRERRIELAFENHRYFDTKRWLIAENANIHMYGMNVDGTTRDEFNRRKEFETRVFDSKYYLWPIPQDEIYKNKKLVQNPGWQSEDIK